jgi:adenylate kinase
MKAALVVILIGPPGAGKTALAVLLSAAHQVPVISMDELKPRRVKASDEELNQRVVARLSQPDCNNGIIFDSYPRSPAQARYLEIWLLDHGFAPPIVINLDLPDDKSTRLAEYRHEVGPLIEFYRTRPHYYTLPAQRPRSETFSSIEAILPTTAAAP